MKPKDLHPAPTLDLLTYIRAIGHDVGAPVRHVRGFSTLLDDEIGATLSEEARLLLDQIKTSAEMAERMIYAIHDIAYLGSHVNTTRVPSLLPTLQQAQDLLEGQALALTVNGDSHALTDERLLARLIANLMRNTIAYATQPSMRVNISREGNRVQVILADEGPGFSPEKWPWALQPFKRLNARPNLSALGLGLTEAAHIAGLLNLTMAYADGGKQSFSIVLTLPTTGTK